MTTPPTPTPLSRASRLPLALLLVALAAYLTLVGLHGRLFNIDEVFYKAAGGNWAVRGLFAAPELTGRLPFDPPIAEVFACYPPVYPFTFGLYSKVVGFGIPQIAWFDALLRVAVCLLTYRVARRLGPDIPSRWPAAIAALLVLPLGPIGRPDDLAKLFGMAACLLVLTSPVARARLALAGVLLGLCAATSMLIGGVFALLAAGLFGLAPGHTKQGSRVGGVSLMALSSIVIFAFCLTPLLMVDLGALSQLTMHGEDNLRKPGVLKAWVAGWDFGRFTIVSALAVHVAALLLIPADRSSAALKKWIRHFAPPALFFMLVVLLTDAKFYYLWFAGPWMIAVVSTMIVQTWQLSGARFIPLIVAGLMLAGGVYGAQFWVVERLVLAVMPREKRYSAVADGIRAIVPPGDFVIAFEHWPTFLGRNKVHDPNFPMSDEERSLLKYIVMTGNGSRAPGQSQPMNPLLSDYVAEHFELIHDDLAREPLRLFGKRITNSAYGWGAAIYRRREPATPPPQSPAEN